MEFALRARSLIRVRGENSASFLQGLVTQDVQPHRSFAAAFLNAKGRVLCDAIFFPRGDEFLIDVHKSVAPSLMRTLIRHKLREVLDIELAPECSVTWRQLPETEHRDPRNAHLGSRLVVETRFADTLEDGDARFFRRRLACGIPEGPVEIPAAKALPLHFNMDLNNCISFNKGCYVGQELTHRSFHVGKVRKRVCRVSFNADFAPTSPIPEPFDENASLPFSPDGENEVSVPVDDDKWRVCGRIISADANVGLCVLTSERSLNARENILAHIGGDVFFCGQKLRVTPPLFETI